jgi:hypothetical protein
MTHPTNPENLEQKARSLCLKTTLGTRHPQGKCGDCLLILAFARSVAREARKSERERIIGWLQPRPVTGLWRSEIASAIRALPEEEE